jgi:hypothetical protein
MNSKRLNRLRRRWEDLRSASADIKRRKLEGLAISLGLTRAPRGKEPTYINADFPHLRPVSIPSHREINEFTAKDILGQLEEHILEWEERLKAEGKEKGANDEQDS